MEKSNPVLFLRVPILCDFEPLHQHVRALHNLVKAAQSLDEMSQTITDLLNEQKVFLLFFISRKEDIIFKTVEYFHNIVLSNTLECIFVFCDIKINCISFLSNHELVNILRIFNRYVCCTEVVEVELRYLYCCFLSSSNLLSAECVHSAFIALVCIQWICYFSRFLHCSLGPFSTSS